VRFFVALCLLIGLVGFAEPRIAHALKGPPPLLNTGGTLTLPAGPVMVFVWASWCHACQTEARTVAMFEDAHPGLTIVGVDEDRQAGVGASAADGWGWRHGNVWDPDSRIGHKIAPEGIPTTLFLDAKHRVVKRITGVASRFEFEVGLSKL
jgi:thiol-disulfide isomerase/thioredoxin